MKLIYIVTYDHFNRLRKSLNKLKALKVIKLKFKNLNRMEKYRYEKCFMQSVFFCKKNKLTEISTIATVNREGIGAVFTLGVRIIEYETVAAGLERGRTWCASDCMGKK